MSQPIAVNTMPTAGYRQRLRSVQAVNCQLLKPYWCSRSSGALG